MEKNFEETKMFEIFASDFDAKVSLYSTDVELGPDFPYEVFTQVIKAVLRGTVSFVKEHEAAADTVAVHCVDEKNNFIAAMIISKEADDEGKTSYELSFVTNEDDYDAQKDSFDKIVEANEPAIMKFLANYLVVFSSNNGNQGMRVADDNAGIMYVSMLAFFMSINAYANNLTEDEVKEDGGLVVKFDDELIINIKNENGKRHVEIEPGTALKTFVKSDTSDQQA